MKIWHKIPAFFRWLLVTSLLLGLTAGSVYAYKALTAKESVTVLENLSWVGSNEYEVSLYPLESDTHIFTIANAGSVNMDVAITSKVSPTAQDITVVIPTSVIVPAKAEASFSSVVTVGKSAPPKTYTITIDIER